MDNDSLPWSDWEDNRACDPGLVEIEKSHEQILELERNIGTRKESIKEMILNLERQLYEGLTFREYIKELQSKPIIKGDIQVKIVGEMIYGELIIQEPNRKVVISYDINIDKNYSYGGSRMYTPRKTIEVPKKYETQLEELKIECHKYQVDDMTMIWRRVYGIDVKRSMV